MLRFFLRLRFVMLIASVGAAVGALLMFWEGVAEVSEAARAAMSGADRKTVVTFVMRGTDFFLFGIVLVIFAYAISLGFVLDPSLRSHDRLPSWMRITSVSELKEALVEVILLYLLVDFATDWPQSEGELSWEILAKPLSILAIAAAFGLFPRRHSDASRERNSES